MLKFDGIEVVLLDIEGTVCPISFVKDTLFPYALQALPSVLKDKWTDPTFKPYRDAFPIEHRQSPDAMISHVQDLTAQDVKIAYLKNLQGYLWQSGYENGSYSTPLFSDVVPSLREWKDKGSIQLSIYSSGSVFAQKLLFAHVKQDGRVHDMTDLISEWFDTTNAGPKTDSSSYAKISEKLKRKPSSVLFFSDNVKEVEAAVQAGMQAVVVDRPGNAAVSETDRSKHRVIDKFEDVEVNR